MVAEDVALRRILAMKERVIVMDLVMEVVMMDTRAVKEILYVGAIIVRSLVCFTMRRMTVVRNPQLPVLSKNQDQLSSLGLH